MGEDLTKLSKEELIEKCKSLQSIESGLVGNIEQLNNEIFKLQTQINTVREYLNKVPNFKNIKRLIKKIKNF